MVPGHELVGTVIEVGPKVTKVKVGDNVGIGCMVDSCLDCKKCKKGEEQYCAGGSVFTYNGKKMHKHVGGNPDTQTFGGYTGSYVCYEHFVCKVPDNLPLEQVGPLMCAGITMYDPLRHWGAVGGEKMTIGIAGVGGLGTMGIKLAKALGHRVVAITRSADKIDICKKKGADTVLVSSDPESFKSEMGNIDLILDSIPANHQAGDYIPLLGVDGTLVVVGIVPEPHHIQ